MPCEVNVDAVLPRFVNTISGIEFQLAVATYSPCDQEAVLVVETSLESHVDLEYRDAEARLVGSAVGDAVRKRVTLSPEQEFAGVKLAAIARTDGLGAMPFLNVYYEDEDGERLSDDLPNHLKVLVSIYV